MNIIITGVKGQLGYDVLKELFSRGYKNVIGVGKEELDITSEKSVVDFFNKNKPCTIIHCAAYTAVEKAEENKEICMNVNFTGTKNLIKQAKRFKAKFVYISTDYVFDGEKESPYSINDLPNPQSVYGLSKYLGELETLKYDKHFIVRISWVFGKNGFNFVNKMLNLSSKKSSLKVISDQFGSPTYTRDLSILIGDLIETRKYGIYHGSNEGLCTWYEFAKEIFRLSKINIELNPIKSSQFLTKAKRPKNSVLDKSSIDKNGFNRLPEWKTALERYLKEIEVI